MRRGLGIALLAGVISTHADELQVGWTQVGNNIDLDALAQFDMAFSGDGNRLAVVGNNTMNTSGTVRVFNYYPLTLPVEITTEASPITIKFMADVPATYTQVEYKFTNTSSNGPSSDWQSSEIYVASNLSPDTEYTYTVEARDLSLAQEITTVGSYTVVTDAIVEESFQAALTDLDGVLDGANEYPHIEHALAVRGLDFQPVDTLLSISLSPSGAIFDGPEDGEWMTSWISSVATNYDEVDVVFEATVVRSKSEETAYFGIGASTAGYDFNKRLPDFGNAGGAYLLEMQDTENNTYLVNNLGETTWNPEDNAANPASAIGSHRLQLVGDSLARTFTISVDEDYAGGDFVADSVQGSVSFDDIWGATADPSPTQNLNYEVDEVIYVPGGQTPSEASWVGVAGGGEFGLAFYPYTGGEVEWADGDSTLIYSFPETGGAGDGGGYFQIDSPAGSWAVGVVSTNRFSPADSNFAYEKYLITDYGISGGDIVTFEMDMKQIESASGNETAGIIFEFYDDNGGVLDNSGELKRDLTSSWETYRWLISVPDEAVRVRITMIQHEDQTVGYDNLRFVPNPSPSTPSEPETIAKLIFGGYGGITFKDLSIEVTNRDADGDGLSDEDEINIHGTDPNNSDSDGDGLNDEYEVNTSSTDPNDSDSDDDGLSDAFELRKRYEVITDSDDDLIFKTWPEAQADASARGGYLVTINSQEEWDSVKTILDTYYPRLDYNWHFWLGGSDKSNEGQWEWITGEPWEFTAWRSGEPDGALNENYLVSYHPPNYEWTDFPDTYTCPYIIEFEINSSNPNDADSDNDGLNDGYEVNVSFTDPDNPDSDGDGLTDFEEIIGIIVNDKSYELIEGSFTWHEARDDAIARGGHLATITSSDEWNIVDDIIIGDAWLGGTDENNEGDWVWITGEPWNEELTFWRDGSPNNNGNADFLYTHETWPWDDAISSGDINGNYGYNYVLEVENTYTNSLGTSPKNYDSDNDGVSDGDEVASGTDPNLRLALHLPLIMDANDDGGAADNGIVSDIIFTNNGAYFNGSSSQIIVDESDDLNLGSRLTISTWINVSDWQGTGGNQTYPIVVMNDYSYWPADAHERAIWAALNENTIDLTIRPNDSPDGSDFITTRASSTAEPNFNSRISGIELNEWALMTWIYDGTNVTTYLNNGLLIENELYSNGVEYVPYTGYRYVRIGHDQEGDSSIPYNGYLRNLRIYDGAISTNALNELYNEDSDGDGLSDSDEFNIYLTNPDIIDTDADGLSDGYEINTSLTNPNDSDSDDDGLSDGYEVNTSSTDPNDSDSDDDDLTDSYEVNTSSTDPNDADSDGDGLSDEYELRDSFYEMVIGEYNWGSAKTDAEARGGRLAVISNEMELIRVFDLIENSDLTRNRIWIGAQKTQNQWTWIDGSEWTLGFINPLLDPDGGQQYVSLTSGEPENLALVSDWPYNEWAWDSQFGNQSYSYVLETTKSAITDPNDADSDDDGLPDGYEVNTSSTNPNDSDSDDDGLADGYEVNTSTTNPNDADSDDDGINDGYEVNALSTDPNDSDSDDDGLLDLVELEKIYELVPSTQHGEWTVNGALNEAAAQGGYLARITSEAEWNQIKEMILLLPEIETARFYLIGGSDVAEEGVWVSNTGENLTFTNWAQNEPNNISEFYPNAGEADYLVISTPEGDELSWRDFPSSSPAYTVGAFVLERLEANVTDPNDPDSDGDGLNDGYEVNISSTDPNNTDSDDDGLSDGYEVNIASTDPNDSDSDNDGLTDGYEVHTSATNPNDADTDNDGLSDEFELNSAVTNSIFQVIGSAPDDLYTWQEARDDAESRGGFLATVTSTNEWISLLSQIGQHGDVWLGGTDQNEEGSWEWITGESWIVDFWISGSPSGSANDPGEDHLNAGWYPGNEFHAWNDESEWSELTYVLETISIAPSSSTDPNDSDSDDDGLIDGYEVNTSSTDPNDADSDDDDLTDGYEVNTSFTDPNDADSDDDGLTDAYELNTSSTDPNDADSDDDDLTDGYEVNTSLTDPNDADSDDDDLTDSYELNTSFTDPNDSDSDDDDLTDGYEVNASSTDPNDSDSDDDGLTDGDEVNTASTDPNDADSDDDGLSDGYEVNMSSTDPNDADSDDDDLTDSYEVNSSSTDPNDSDSDDDGLIDGYEVNTSSTDPNDADSDDDDLTDPTS